MRGLYAIIDTDALARRGVPLIPFAEAVLAARPAALQLRDKHGSPGRTLALLRELAPRAAAAGVPLYANDRPDLALLGGCDGVHVGQGDLPVSAVRELAERAGARGLRIGLSTCDRAELEAALAEPVGCIDYVAIGPVFATQNKENADPAVGLDMLAALAARVREARPGLGVVAIGGITRETAGAVGARSGCAAVIGAILPEGAGPLDPAAVTARAAELHAAIVEGSRT